MLVLHGGRDSSAASTRWRDLAIVRLWPVARFIAGRMPTAAVYRLRFSVRGWNGSGGQVLQDARWALEKMRADHPGLPIVVVGHSMGGRVALYVGNDPDVAGLVLLAPWAASHDPAEQLAGVPVMVIHGARDRMIPVATTRPWTSRASTAGARLTQIVLPWGGHAMLWQFRVWHRLAADGVRTVLAQSSVATPRQSPAG